MLQKIPQAVWIISALSLLLGLSLGQIHRQYAQIESLRAEIASREHPAPDVHPLHSLDLQLGRLRMEMDLKREILEKVQREWPARIEVRVPQVDLPDLAGATNVMIIREE